MEVGEEVRTTSVAPPTAQPTRKRRKRCVCSCSGAERLKWESASPKRF
eukprot:COSAG04_NODE_3045_length_3243_cov_3.883588_3_plen_48_part_00